MAKPRRKLARVPVIVSIVLLTLVADAEPASSGPLRQFDRVRSEDPDIRDIIAEARQRSATFNGLVAAIDRTDGIVYVQRGRCGNGVRACLAMLVTVAGPSRILRVVVDPQKSHDETMVSLGHELRHVLEVLVEPAITSAALMFSYYKRFGVWIGDAFETRAAEAAGSAVRLELGRSRDRANQAPRPPAKGGMN